MVSKRRIIFYTIITALILSFIIAIYVYKNKISRVLTPFFMAFVISYFFRPLVIKLEKRNIPRKYGILIVYLLFVMLVLAVGFFLVPEMIKNIKDLMNTIPEVTNTYQSIFDNVILAIQSSDWSQDIKNVLFNEIKNNIAVVQNFVLNTLSQTLTRLIQASTMIFDFIIAMAVSYYFIKDANFFKRLVLSLIPCKWRKGFALTGRKVHGVISNFVEGQLLTAVIVGVLETIGLLIVKVKYAFILGLIGGIANIIPYFGPIIGAVPAVALALLDSPIKGLWTVLVFVIVQQLENTFISPRIIKEKLGMHPVTTIFAVIAGAQFFGVPGMLLAVPVTAILKVLVKSLIDAVV